MILIIGVRGQQIRIGITAPKSLPVSKLAPNKRGGK
jgi:sRNA-binding carbon storage regulator CsrA